LIGRRQHSSVVDVRFFRAAHCDPDHYLVGVKGRERLAVHKQTTHMFHMETCCLKELNKMLIELGKLSEYLNFNQKVFRIL
jgi:hypothetical protein